MKLREAKSKTILTGLAFGLLFSVGFGVQQSKVQAESTSQKTLIAAKGELIDWETTYDSALSKAKKEKKHLLIDVYTDWCGWCKVLDKKVYQNAEAAEFINKSFVCLKSNAEKGDGIKVASRFKVSGFPATIVLNGKGEKIGSISGFLPPEKFTARLSEILKSAN